MMGYLSALI